MIKDIRTIRQSDTYMFRRSRGTAERRDFRRFMAEAPANENEGESPMAENAQEISQHLGLDLAAPLPHHADLFSAYFEQAETHIQDPLFNWKEKRREDAAHQTQWRNIQKARLMDLAHKLNQTA